MNSTSFFEKLMPHGMCYAWRSDILWLHVLSDISIAFAYFSIPVVFYYYLRKRPSTPVRGVVIMFSVFIFACGLTHLFGIWVIWNGHYGYQGLLKAITALASIATALMLYPNMPRILALRTPKELQAANTALKDEVAQRKLAESRYREFIESAPDPIVIIDTSGQIVLVNEQTEAMFGQSRDDLLGMSVQLLLPHGFQTAQSFLLSELRVNALRHDRIQRSELFAEKVNGEVFPVEISLRTIGTPEQQLISVSIRNITDRKELEQQTEKLQRDLIHVSRVTTMDQLAAGLAHELNQPLTAATQYLDAAILSTDQNSLSIPELKELLLEIENETHRAGDIIRSLRQVTTKGISEKSPVDLNSLIQQTIRLIEHEARTKNVTIRVEPTSFPTIIADRVQITQVLINLIRNSVDAMVNADSPLKEVRISSEMQEDNIVINVQDTGPGLPPDLEIFTPFASTKKEGMGMGLSISKTIVEAHGGQLWCDQNIPEGTRLSILLPLARNREEQDFKESQETRMSSYLETTS